VLSIEPALWLFGGKMTHSVTMLVKVYVTGIGKSAAEAVADAEAEANRVEQCGAREAKIVSHRILPPNKE